MDSAGKFEAGICIELLESKSDRRWILDGWSLDAFGSRKSLGLGVAKDLYKNELIEIDAGVYVTKEMKKFFDTKFPVEVSVGLSGSWRF